MFFLTAARAPPASLEIIRPPRSGGCVGGLVDFGTEAEQGRAAGVVQLARKELR